MTGEEAQAWAVAIGILAPTVVMLYNTWMLRHTQKTMVKLEHNTNGNFALLLAAKDETADARVNAVRAGGNDERIK